jgi:hypothetical protein
MMIRTLLALFWLGAARAEEPQATDREIEQALQNDQKAARPSASAGAKQPEAPGAPAATGAPASGWTRFIQSLNPDIAAIVNFAAGYYSSDATVKGEEDPAHTGFNVQELEVALQAVVDPYFRLDIFLTLPNLQDLGVEEAFVTTRSLPANLQIRAGIFRANIGRQNTQHLHVQDFTRRPTQNELFLGVDGLRAPGLEINWLVPKIPFYLLLTVSAFSVGAADADLPLHSFGGGARYDFTYLANARAFWPLAESTSLYLGLSYAYGRTSQQTTKNPLMPGVASQPAPTAYDNRPDHLFAIDSYLKWKPANVARTYTSLAWQSEYFLRYIPSVTVFGLAKEQLEGGLYTQLVLQAARLWYFGVRGEIEGIPAGDNVKREYAGSASATVRFSEFSMLRLYGEVRFPENQSVQWAAFVQFQASIGAHGAHSF